MPVFIRFVGFYQSISDEVYGFLLTSFMEDNSFLRHEAGIGDFQHAIHFLLAQIVEQWDLPEKFGDRILAHQIATSINVRLRPTASGCLYLDLCYILP
jgi:hypothetical protein